MPALAFLNQDYNLLLFDFRYLGESQGAYSTAGAKEVEDLLAAIRYLKTRGVERVGVFGFSLGGAVALQAAVKTPAIKAVAAQSSYAQLDLLAPQLYRLPLLRYPLGWLTVLWARLILGIEAEKVSPLASARNLTIPVLIIHSPTDEVIPFGHALLLQKALQNNPQAEFWFPESLRHGELESEFQNRLTDFFKKNLL